MVLLFIYIQYGYICLQSFHRLRRSSSLCKGGLQIITFLAPL